MDDSIQLISLAIEQSSEGIAIVNLEGSLQYLNDAFAKIHEYSVKELIGKNLSLLHTPQHMPSVKAADKQVKKTGSFKGEIWHVTRSGTEFCTLTHNSLLRNDMGNFKFVDKTKTTSLFQKQHFPDLFKIIGFQFVIILTAGKFICFQNN